MNRTTTLNTMKRFAALLTIAVSIAGCQKANDSTGIQSRGNGNPRSQGQPGGGSQINGISYTGMVTAPASYQDLFNDLVKDFMEASVSRDYVGYVSATGANNTGVYVGGRVQLSGGQAIHTTNSNGSIDPSSELIVGVFDYWPNQSNLQPLPPAYFKGGASGTINGNTADIRFQDDYGTVEMQGQFDANYFTGSFYFSTDKIYDGSAQGGAGTLGTFKIPTCQFFRCN